MHSVIVKRYSLSPDGKVYTFELFRNNKFSNGYPLTANSIKVSLERVISKLGKSSEWAFGFVQGFQSFIKNKVRNIK